MSKLDALFTAFILVVMVSAIGIYQFDKHYLN